MASFLAQEAEELAALLSVLIPVLASVVVTILCVIGCCCMVNTSTVTIKKKFDEEMKDTTYEEIDLTYFENEKAKNLGGKTKSNKKPTASRPKTPKISLDQSAVTEPSEDSSKPNDIHETVQDDKEHDNVVDNEMPNGKKLSVISDPGYQANMRFLLQR